MTDEDRQWVLDEHNKYRNSLAKGEDSRGGNGKSSNMRALVNINEAKFLMFQNMYLINLLAVEILIVLAFFIAVWLS